MDRIRIVGGHPLSGTIPISGAKNAALPLMIASLLTSETLTLENVPRLTDVTLLTRILGNHGVDFSVDGKRSGASPHKGQTIHLTASDIADTTAPYDLVSRMRASFWVIAPLLARTGNARVSLPGGCALGTRPVDLILHALEKFGAQIDIEAGYVVARASKGLKGCEIKFDKVTVGGTHTALMAASLAAGHSVLHNAACEPEVVDLALCLSQMGARIKGAGTSVVEIEGVPRLFGTRHHVLPDRIEAGTYAAAIAMTGGNVVLEGAHPHHLPNVLALLEAAGAHVSLEPTGMRIQRHADAIKPIHMSTAPYPGFPTDLQAQFMALMTKAQGTSRITETIFENRFMHVQELARFGARIHLVRDTAIVEGVEQLKGAPVMATDLRASVSLVIAGLGAEGETMLHRVYHLDRGFERFEEKLRNCGAMIERLATPA